MSGFDGTVVAPELRASWERYVEVRQKAERTQLFCDGRATAEALFDFLSATGGIVRLLALVGPLIAPEDPTTALLWRLASRCRPSAGARP